MSKKFLFAMLAAVLTFGALTGCGKFKSVKKPIKARTVAEDEKLGIKFSEDKKILLRYNKKLRDTGYAVPDGVATIGYRAFHECPRLTSVTISSSVTTIGEEAFDGCSGLTSVTIPPSVKTIGKGAFHGCYKLTSVTIPSSVTTIGEEAFFCCFDLTSVTITEGVTTIGNGAFAECPCEPAVKKQFPYYR